MEYVLQRGGGSSDCDARGECWLSAGFVNLREIGARRVRARVEEFECDLTPPRVEIEEDPPRDLAPKSANSCETYKTSIAVRIR